MKYYVCVANGEAERTLTITEVDKINLNDGVYTLIDKDGIVLFSAPVDAVVFIALS